MLDMTSFGKYFFIPSLPIKKKKKRIKGMLCLSHFLDHAEERMVPISTGFLFHCWFSTGVLSCNIERVPPSVHTLPLQAVIEGPRARASPLVKMTG